MPAILELSINGVKRQVEAPPEQSLLSVLHDNLDLTGAKYGCGEGRCGACTVILDGKAVRSCQTLASECTDKKITTIEGLEKDGKLHPLQQSFLDCDAMQCGYCTPGMILSGSALLAKKPEPTLDEIVTALDGNMCRCGTYSRILCAVQAAAKSMKGGSR